MLRQVRVRASIAGHRVARRPRVGNFRDLHTGEATDGQLQRGMDVTVAKLVGNAGEDQHLAAVALLHRRQCGRDHLRVYSEHRRTDHQHVRDGSWMNALGNTNGSEVDCIVVGFAAG